MNYLIDTDKLINFLKGGQKEILEFQKLTQPSLFLSVINIAEYFEGAYRSSNPEKQIKLIQDFIRTAEIQTLPIDEDIAVIYATEQAKLAGRGERLGGFDLLIAATCLRFDLVLLTGNIKDFSRIEELKIYQN